MSFTNHECSRCRDKNNEESIGNSKAHKEAGAAPKSEKNQADIKGGKPLFPPLLHVPSLKHVKQKDQHNRIVEDPIEET